MPRYGGNGIGIAVGPRGLTAVLPGRAGVPAVRVELKQSPGGGVHGDDLARSLASLKANLEGTSGVSTDGATVHVALLPPLADTRIVPLPPLRRAEAEAVLSRDLDRYFLASVRPGVVGARLPGRRGKTEEAGATAQVPVLATAASLDLLGTLGAGLVRTGWRIGSFCPAHGAWLAGAGSVEGPAVDSVVAVVDSTAHVVRLAGPDPVAVRQVPSHDPEALAQAAGPGRSAVFCGHAEFSILRSQLASAGSEAQRDPEGWSGAEEAAGRWAAASRIEIVPPKLVRLRRKGRARIATGLILGGTVLLVASLGASLWGAHRELNAVREARAALRDQVTPLLDARDSLEMLQTQAQSLDRLSRSSPIWTRSLVELSAVLPRDTHLTGLFASGDTLEIEGAGARAGEAIQALREAGIFEEVRLLGLVEREMEAGETIVERFRLWARLSGESGQGGRP